jgi:hypothetical protein
MRGRIGDRRTVDLRVLLLRLLLLGIRLAKGGRRSEGRNRNGG